MNCSHQNVYVQTEVYGVKATREMPISDALTFGIKDFVCVSCGHRGTMTHHKEEIALDNYCNLCGTEIFSEDFYDMDVLPGLCPECSLEAEDYFGDEAEEMVAYL